MLCFVQIRGEYSANFLTLEDAFVNMNKWLDNIMGSLTRNMKPPDINSCIPRIITVGKIQNNSYKTIKIVLLL